MLHTIIFLIIFLPVTIFLSVSSIILGPLDKRGRTVAWVGQVWSYVALKAAGIRLDVTMADIPKDGSLVFMANHQSLLDILVLFRVLHPYRVCFVAKESLFAIPIFGYGMRKAGHVAIDRSNRRRAMKSIEEAVDRTRWGRSIIIFPEGTRARELDKLQDFKIGGMVIALKANRPIVPLVLSGSATVLPKGRSLPLPGRHTVKVRMLPPIEPGKYTIKEREKLMQDLHDKMQKAYAELIA